MVDLLVLTNLDQLIFILKILFTFLQNSLQLLIRRSTVLSHPILLVFPGLTLQLAFPDGIVFYGCHLGRGKAESTA